MAYAKFDDPNVKVDGSQMKAYGAFWLATQRRALQGISNRLINGTAGTQTFLTAIVGAASGTGGISTTNAVTAVMDGAVYTIAAQAAVAITATTMGTNTVAKFLVYAGTNGSVFVSGPGNVVDKGDSVKAYASAAAAALDAKLPDLPDGYCALGWCQIQGPVASKVIFPMTAIGTCGTVTYGDLVCMPLNQ